MLNVLSNRRTHARDKDPVSSLVDVSNVTVADIEPQVYTGDVIVPGIVATYAGETLVEGRDYSLTFSNNVNVGTGVITMIGLGGYTGTKTITFRIGSSWDFVLRAAELTSYNRLTPAGASGVQSGLSYVRPQVVFHDGHVYLFAFTVSWLGGAFGYGHFVRVDLTDADFDDLDFAALPKQDVDIGLGGLRLNTTFNSAGTEIAYTDTYRVGFSFNGDGTRLRLVCGCHPYERCGSSYPPGPSLWDIPLSAPYDLSVLASATELDESWRCIDRDTGKQFVAFGNSDYSTTIDYADDWDPSGENLFLTSTGYGNLGTILKVRPGDAPFDIYATSRRTTRTYTSTYNRVNYEYPCFTGDLLGPTSASQTVRSMLEKAGATLPTYGSVLDIAIASDGCSMLVPVIDRSETSTHRAHRLYKINFSTPWDFTTLSAVHSVEEYDFPLLPGTGSSTGDYQSVKSVAKVGEDRLLVFSGSQYYSAAGSYVSAYKLPSPDLAVSAKVESIPVQYYTGEALEPKPVVVVGSLTLVEGVDYVLSYDDNVGSPDTALTDATVHIRGIGDFRGTKDVGFRIGRFEDFIRVEEISDREYAGLVPICPTVVARDYNGDVMVEGEDADFTVTYEDNVHPGVARIRMTGVFEGSPWEKVVEFNIVCDISRYGIFGSVPDQAYTSRPLEPSPAMMLADGHALVEGADFKVQSYSGNTGPGTGTVTVEGVGFYYGTASSTFLIRYDAATYMEIEQVGAQLYTLAGGYPAPDPVVRGVGGALLVKNRDYTVAHQYTAPGLNVIGYVTVAVTGVGAYMGIAYSNKATMNRSLSEAYVDPPIAAQPYTGSEMRPEFTVKIDVPVELNADGTVKRTSARTLVRDTDYSVVSWSDNTAAGTAHATIVGITTNGFGGSLDVPFTISYQAPGTYFTVGSIQEQTMSGPAPVEPVPNVTCSNGLVVVRGVDYVVDYENNSSVGTAVATVRGIGAYEGLDPVSREFSVVSRFAIAPIDDQVYTGGNPVCPEPVVTGWDGTTLRESYDYVVTYAGNLGIGTATLTVSGVKDGVAWAYSAPFRIRADIASEYVKCDDIPDQLADGADDVLEPEFMVKLENGTVLVPGVDYSLEWHDNVGPGRAKVMITGVSELVTGTRTLDFLIRSSLPVHAVVRQIPDQRLGWGRFGAVGTAMPFATTSGQRPVDGNNVTAMMCHLNANVVRPTVVVDSEGVRLTEGIGYFTDYEYVKPVTFVVTQGVAGADRVVEAEPGEVKAVLDGTGVFIGKAYSNTAKIRADIGCAFVRFGKFSRVYAGLPIKPVIEIYAMYGDTNQTLTNMSVPPTVVELDTGRYLSVVGNELHEFDSAGQDVGTYNAGFATSVWDFNGVAMFIRNGSNWSKYGSPLYQSRLKATEFSVIVENNDAVGTASVTARGTNGFAGTVTRTFEILHPFVIDGIPDTSYTGDPVEPEPVVRLRSSITGEATDVLLSRDTDYTVTYSDVHTAPGDYEVTVTGTGRYSHAAPVVIPFRILGREISKVELAAEVEYTGDVVEPELVVRDGDTVLVRGVDYTVTYSDGHTAPGEYEVTVTGINRYAYTDPIVRKFDIWADVSVHPELIAVNGFTSGDTVVLRPNRRMVRKPVAVGSPKLTCLPDGVYVYDFDYIRDEGDRYDRWVLHGDVPAPAVMYDLSDCVSSGVSLINNAEVEFDGRPIPEGTNFTVRFTTTSGGSYKNVSDGFFIALNKFKDYERPDGAAVYRFGSVDGPLLLEVERKSFTYVHTTTGPDGKPVGEPAIAESGWYIPGIDTPQKIEMNTPYGVALDFDGRFLRGFVDLGVVRFSSCRGFEANITWGTDPVYTGSPLAPDGTTIVDPYTEESLVEGEDYRYVGEDRTAVGEARVTVEYLGDYASNAPVEHTFHIRAG